MALCLAHFSKYSGVTGMMTFPHVKVSFLPPSFPQICLWVIRERKRERKTPM